MQNQGAAPERPWFDRLGMVPSRRFWSACLALAAVLLAIQLSFLELAGIQQDEALFLRPFLRGESAPYSWAFGNTNVPVMLMDYVGGLKTWLYWPVFWMWRPGLWSIRLPVCLLSLGTLLLFAGLVRRVTDARVALGAALLLAVDSSFALTNVFDWGPVALLMAGTVACMGLLVRFAASAGKVVLLSAFLLAGLMLWYKVVFAFPLTGMLIACAVVIPRQVWQRATTRNLAVALTGLLIGASPLLFFNFRTAGATLKAASYVEHTTANEKLMMLRLTLNGKALEHYMFRSTPEEILPLRGAPLGQLVQSWYRESSLGLGSFLLVGLFVSGVALPFLKASRLFSAIAFGWVAGLSTMALFLISGSAGAGPHHMVLLFPIPQFIVPATMAAIEERARGRFRNGLLPGVLALVVASNLILLTEYHRAALRNGFSVYWTDATRQLPLAIRKEGKPVAFLDWGIEAPTRIESGDTIQVVPPIPARPGILYVTHTAEYRISESETQGILSDAALRGLTVSDAKTVADSQGRPVISVFSLEAASSPFTADILH